MVSEASSSAFTDRLLHCSLNQDVNIVVTVPRLALTALDNLWTLSRDRDEGHSFNDGDVHSVCSREVEFSV